MVPTRIWRASLVGLLIALWPTRAVPEVPQVDVALALAIDVSYSVDNYEHRLQMEGFASALQSPEVIEAIKRGKHQRIAVTIYQWSDENNQSVLVPWRVIATEQDAREVGEFLALGRRNVSEGGTAITASLYFAAGLFATAPAAERQVIDLPPTVVTTWAAPCARPATPSPRKASPSMALRSAMNGSSSQATSKIR
jgi:hypothetical protein